MKTYTIIGGVNGVGKSSLTGVLRRELDDLGTVLDTDSDAGERKIDSCLQKGVCFTQETTLSGGRTVRTARAAREAGYQVRLYYVGLNSIGESLARIRNRVARGGHDIPAGNVLRRFERRFADLARILPYCDTAVFYDNENGFAEVAEYKNGELLLKGPYRPEWVLQLDDYLKQADL